MHVSGHQLTINHLKQEGKLPHPDILSNCHLWTFSLFILFFPPKPPNTNYY